MYVRRLTKETLPGRSRPTPDSRRSSGARASPCESRGCREIAGSSVAAAIGGLRTADARVGVSGVSLRRRCVCARTPERSLSDTHLRRGSATLAGVRQTPIRL